MKDSTKPKDATSYKETAFGVIPRQELIGKEVEGIAKGLQHILSLKNTAKLNTDLLLKIHWISFGWIFPNWAGKYRTIEVQTSTHVFPNHREIPMLLQDFFADLNERLKHDFDPIEVIAWAQHRITWIHPFQDYNGRTARLFSNYLMLRFGLPLKEIKVESESERQEYINALKAADKGNFIPLQKLLKNAIENT